MSDDNIKKSVDLSVLQDMQFSTAWTPSTNTKKFEQPRDRGGFRGRPSRDFRKEDDSRKEGYRKREFSSDRGRGEGDEKKSFGKKGFRKDFKKGFNNNRAPFKFSMEVMIYPEDAPFEKLIGAMRHLKRTYQLFDIAELVLEKHDRFILVAKNLPEESGVSKPLYCSQPENIPFENEVEAKTSALSYWLKELFEEVEVEVEAPKGSFQVINKCGITGELLGAPNWHKYQETLVNYHKERFPRMAYEKFLSSIETIRDEGVVTQWLESMKKRVAYKLKGTEEIFESKESAFEHISKDKGDTLVKQYDQVRMRGSDIVKMPYGRIRKNIEQTWHKQKKFPMATANNLRGRLRRAGFTIYKRGSNGFAFVCAIKRKFLYEGDKLSENPQKVFDFIVANAGIKSFEFPYKYCGLESSSSTIKTPSLSEAHEKGDELGASVGDIKEEESFTIEQLTLLKGAATELLWLISEGYVVEYANGSLQANPYLPRPKEKVEKSATIPSDIEEIEEMNLGSVADEPIVEVKESKESEETCEGSEDFEEVEGEGSADKELDK